MAIGFYLKLTTSENGAHRMVDMVRVTQAAQLSALLMVVVQLGQGQGPKQGPKQALLSPLASMTTASFFVAY